MGCVGGKSTSAAAVADCNNQNIFGLGKGWKDKVFQRGNSFWVKAIPRLIQETKQLTSKE